MEAKEKGYIQPLAQECTPLAFRLNKIAKKYYGATSEQFKGLDIERYFFVLSLIGSYEHITQQCLAKSLDIDKATVVRVIDYLSEKGLVKREINPNDRREHIVVATVKARKIIPTIKEVFSGVNTHAFKGFTQNEKDTFIQMTNRMLDNLVTLPAEDFQIKYIKTKKSS